MYVQTLALVLMTLAMIMAFVESVKGKVTSTYMNETHTGLCVMGSGAFNKIKKDHALVSNYTRKRVYVTAGDTNKIRKLNVDYLNNTFNKNYIGVYGLRWINVFTCKNIFSVLSVEKERALIMQVGDHIAEKAGLVDYALVAIGGSTGHIKLSWERSGVSGSPEYILNEAYHLVEAGQVLNLVVGGALSIAVDGGCAEQGQVKEVKAFDSTIIQSKNPDGAELCRFLTQHLASGKIKVYVGSRKHT